MTREDRIAVVESYIYGVGRRDFSHVRFADDVSYESALTPKRTGKDAIGFLLAQFPEMFEGRMHTTDTVDYVTILSGEVWLVLDDGATVHLAPSDCVVQNGTQHSWHNRKQEPCVCAVAMVGAKRQG